LGLLVGRGDIYFQLYPGGRTHLACISPRGGGGDPPPPPPLIFFKRKKKKKNKKKSKIKKKKKKKNKCVSNLVKMDNKKGVEKPGKKFWG